MVWSKKLRREILMFPGFKATFKFRRLWLGLPGSTDGAKRGNRNHVLLMCSFWSKKRPSLKDQLLKVLRKTSLCFCEELEFPFASCFATDQTRAAGQAAVSHAVIVFVWRKEWLWFLWCQFYRTASCAVLDHSKWSQFRPWWSSYPPRLSAGRRAEKAAATVSNLSARGFTGKFLRPKVCFIDTLDFQKASLCNPYHVDLAQKVSPTHVFFILFYHLLPIGLLGISSHSHDGCFCPFLLEISKSRLFEVQVSSSTAPGGAFGCKSTKTMSNIPRISIWSILWYFDVCMFVLLKTCLLLESLMWSILTQSRVDGLFGTTPAQDSQHGRWVYRQDLSKEKGNQQTMIFWGQYIERLNVIVIMFSMSMMTFPSSFLFWSQTCIHLIFSWSSQGISLSSGRDSLKAWGGWPFLAISNKTYKCRWTVVTSMCFKTKNKHLSFPKICAENRIDFFLFCMFA